jgi:hypothetical protein
MRQMKRLEEESHISSQKFNLSVWVRRDRQFRLRASALKKNGHSQVGEYSHSGLLRPVWVEEAIGVPFVSVWSPNLRQAARSHELCVRDIRDLKKKGLTDYRRQ